MATTDKFRRICWLSFPKCLFCSRFFSILQFSNEMDISESTCLFGIRDIWATWAVQQHLLQHFSMTLRNNSLLGTNNGEDKRWSPTPWSTLWRTLNGVPLKSCIGQIKHFINMVNNHWDGDTSQTWLHGQDGCWEGFWKSSTGHCSRSCSTSHLESRWPLASSDSHQHADLKSLWTWKCTWRMHTILCLKWRRHLFQVLLCLKSVPFHSTDLVEYARRQTD